MANNVEITILLDFYGEMLTEKQRDFLSYYYNDDLSLSEIAERNHTTVGKLRKLNGIKGSNIRAGKKIKVK